MWAFKCLHNHLISFNRFISSSYTYRRWNLITSNAILSQRSKRNGIAFLHFCPFSQRIESCSFQETQSFVLKGLFLKKWSFRHAFELVLFSSFHTFFFAFLMSYVPFDPAKVFNPIQGVIIQRFFKLYSWGGGACWERNVGEMKTCRDGN